MESVSVFKTRATRLRKFLNSHGVSLSGPTVLEAQAAQAGVRDWNTLRAAALGKGEHTKAVKPKTQSTGGPNYGFEHLAPYIGGQLEPAAA